MAEAVDIQVTDFHDRDQLDNTYPAEISVLESITGVDKVVIISPPVLLKNKEDPGSTHQPHALDVHAHYSPANAECAAHNRADPVDNFSTRFTRF